MIVRRNVLVLASAAAVLAVAPAAHGHITVSPSEAPAASHLKVEFEVPHGCDGSPTTQVSVKLPEGVVSATPEVNPGWTISTTTRRLAEPLEGEGEQVTETIDTVSWEGGPLAPDQLSEFGLSLELPDDPGTTLYFPVVQTCESGETRWIQIPAAGQDPEELEDPAPALALTAAGAETGGESDDSGGNALAIGLAAGGLAAGLAALVLVLVRRPRT